MRTKNKKISKKDQRKFKKLALQFVEYMFTGGVWFWSGYILIVVLDEPIGLFWANFIGNAVGITLNFILNRLWVFKTKRQRNIQDTATRYVIYTALNAFLLNYLILNTLEEQFSIKPEVGQFIASGFFTFWNYFWYKTWVFKDKKRPRRTSSHPGRFNNTRSKHDKSR